MNGRIGSRRRGFTLVELLVVLAIIAVAMGLVLRDMRQDDRAGLVRAEAERLAATIRRVRAQAIDEKAIYGISFNIQNAPGTSGLVLNNWSGGHWYRIIGASKNEENNSGYGTSPWGMAAIPFAERNSNRLTSDCGWPPNGNTENPFRLFIEDVRSSWMSDPLALPAHKVRFLALTDQDNGNFRKLADGGSCCNFAPSYPRPWFGSWDAATKRLLGWGAYDPAVKDFDQHTDKPSGPLLDSGGQPRSYTGFWYEGMDGPLPGCVNKTDRLIADDGSGDGRYTASDAKDGISYKLFAKGEGRPLVNGDWLDALLKFYPDGSVVYDDWMRARAAWFRYATSQWCNPIFSYSHGNLLQGGPGDMYASTDGGSLAPASSYNMVTGYWSITLAPDADADSDHFDTVEQALHSMRPCWRVAVSATGDVRVVQVRSSKPAGAVFDPTFAPAFYTALKSNPTAVEQYQGLVARGPGNAVRNPADDILVPEMLVNGTWWLQP